MSAYQIFAGSKTQWFTAAPLNSENCALFSVIKKSVRYYFQR